MPVTITVEEVNRAAQFNGQVSTADVQRMLSVAAAWSTRYAPNAPESVLNEAVARIVGYLGETPSPPLASLESAEVKMSYATGQLSAFRHSGAMALLSPWKIRNAGVVE